MELLLEGMEGVERAFQQIGTPLVPAFFKQREHLLVNLRAGRREKVNKPFNPAAIVGRVSDIHIPQHEAASTSHPAHYHPPPSSPPLQLGSAGPGAPQPPPSSPGDSFYSQQSPHPRPSSQPPAQTAKEKRGTVDL